MPSTKTKVIALIMAGLLAACQTTQEQERKERKEEAARIIERTITKPEPYAVEVEKYVSLPPELLVRCGITYRKNDKVGEYVRVADTNTAYLEDCRKQVDAIIKLQPKKSK